MSRIVTVKHTWVHDINLDDFGDFFDGKSDQEIKDYLIETAFDAIIIGQGGDPSVVEATVTRGDDCPACGSTDIDTYSDARACGACGELMPR